MNEVFKISTLYIIGNGFDVAHGLQTNYWKMREYIDERDSGFLGNFETLYNIRPLDDTEPWYTEKAQERWNKSVDHSLWSMFEYQMGNPNTTEMLELSSSVTEGMRTQGIRDHMDLYWEEHFGFIDKLQSYVKEWIETIDTDNIIPIKKCLINSVDLFFNFNYTDILEKVYGIDEVLHIHGGVNSVCDLDPIMGHCNKSDIKKHLEWAEMAAKEYAEAEASIQDAIANYLEKIYKDSQKQILVNDSFFKRLETVNDVVVIGWSGGEVDHLYLRHIINSVSLNTSWTVYWHSNKDLASLENVFEKEGLIDKNVVTFDQSDNFWDTV